MKTILIEYVPNRQWLRVWGLWGVLALGVVFYAGWQWQAHQAIQQQELEQQQALRAQIEALKQPAKPLEPGLLKLRQQVRERLLLDLNPVFATMEGLQEPGVQLRSVNVDTANGVVRLEYALESVAQASLVSEKLNAGYDSKPWALSGVVNAAPVGGNGGRPPMGGMGGTASGVSGAYLGTWVARVDRL